MKRFVVLLVALCLMLGGCGLMDGEYLSITPHEVPSANVQSISQSASNYRELQEILEAMVNAGTESTVISVAKFDQAILDTSVKSAISYIQKSYPMGSWAVDGIEYEIGTGGGQPVVSLNISYIHGRSKIRQVQNVQDMDAAQNLIANALKDCGDSVVLLVDNYQKTDIAQLIEDYAEENPNTIMETPEVAVGIYPDEGIGQRVVELKFAYQTSRDSLRLMQNQVQRVFASAELYLNSDATDAQKYSQLYTFLMERYDYTIETSITPSYSLLIHGVGDSEAFATVYRAMCRRADLECEVISGTKNGESWYWNLIYVDGQWRHVDLLEASAQGEFRSHEADQMQGYVWDYSAYGNS